MFRSPKLFYIKFIKYNLVALSIICAFSSRCDFAGKYITILEEPDGNAFSGSIRCSQVSLSAALSLH